MDKTSSVILVYYVSKPPYVRSALLLLCFEIGQRLYEHRAHYEIVTANHASINKFI